jgi:hypothetical protein
MTLRHTLLNACAIAATHWQLITRFLSTVTSLHALIHICSCLYGVSRTDTHTFYTVTCTDSTRHQVLLTYLLLHSIPYTPVPKLNFTLYFTLPS